MVEFAAGTHTGLIRSRNEDCYEANPELGLWLVADGMGGHEKGDLAASIVRDTIISRYSEGLDLVAAIRDSHRAILEEIIRQGVNSDMGSTVVALSLRDRSFEIAWVGDSRAYLFDGNLRQLTRDHSPVAELLANGAITVAEAAQHTDRHVLSQSLGVSESIAVNPGRVRGRLQPGQQILLCSDGLTDDLNDQAIAAVLRSKSLPQEQVDALLEAALNAGGHDNITLVLVGHADAPNQEYADLAHNQVDGIQRTDARKSSIGRKNTHDSKILVMFTLMVIAGLVWLIS